MNLEDNKGGKLALHNKLSIKLHNVCFNLGSSTKKLAKLFNVEKKNQKKCFMASNFHPNLVSEIVKGQQNALAGQTL